MDGVAALDRTAANGIALRDEDKAAVTTTAIKSLRDQNLRIKLLRSLTSVIYHRSYYDPDAAQFCTMLLFELACNNSGISIQVQNSAASAAGNGKTAVLVWGFAGSSFGLLQPTLKFYERRHPSWRRLAAIGVGLTMADVAEENQRQIDELVQALEGIDKLVVHVFSNFGHMNWVRVAQARPDVFHDKLAACVYDCAADPGTGGEGISSPEQFAYVIVDTVWMCIGANNLKLKDLKTGDELSAFTPDRLRPPIEKAAAYCAEGFGDKFMASSGTTFGWQAEHEPAVPTLCLTSPGDRIIKEAAVEKFADLLRNGARSRCIRVASLKGPHCQLLASGFDLYAKEHSALVAIAQLSADGAADGGQEGEVGTAHALGFLTYDDVQTKIEEEEGDALAALGF